MSGLARFSLANRALVALVAVIVGAFGLLAIPNLKQQLFPSLDFPAAFVVAPYPGAAPEIVERQVTEPIENAVTGVSGLEQVTSTSREGMATIQLAFVFGTDLDDAVRGSRPRSTGLRSPRGSTRRSSPAAPTTFRSSSSRPAPSEDQQAFAERVSRIVLPEIQAVEGVREVELTGVRAQEVVITPNLPAALAAGVDVTVDRDRPADQRGGRAGRNPDRRRADAHRGRRHADHHRR